MPESKKAHITKHLEAATKACSAGDFTAVQHHIGHCLSLIRHGKHEGSDMSMIPDGGHLAVPTGLRDRLKGMKK